jgi:hypothetical protein
MLDIGYRRPEAAGCYPARIHAIVGTTVAYNCIDPFGMTILRTNVLSYTSRIKDSASSIEYFFLKIIQSISSFD